MKSAAENFNLQLMGGGELSHWEVEWVCAALMFIIKSDKIITRTPICLPIK